MIIRAIDVESTGLPTEADKHALVEIGWCDLTDQPWFVDAPGSVLCNPGRPIPAEAMAVHHITDADVADADGSLDALGAPDYFAAHHADFEQQFFTPATPMICTWKASLRVWPDAPSHSLQVLRYHLGLNANSMMASPPHRAGPDAYVCALLLERLIKEGTEIEQMVRWSAGPALLPRVTFGKYRGGKWEDLPTDYLKWLVDKSDMDRDVKANAKHHLAKRAA